MRSTLFLLLLLLGRSLSPAEDGVDSAQARRLSLTQAVDLALEGTFDLRAADAERRAAEADFRKSLSILLPRLSASETFVATNDPLNVFGLKLKQSGVSASDFNPALLNAPDRFQNFATRVEVQQPLFNLDGMFGRHAASRAADAAGQKYVRTRAAIVLGAKASYYQLALARRTLLVLRESLLAAGAYRDQAKAFYEEGMIQRSDALMAEVRFLEIRRKVAEAENGVASAENALRLLLGLDDRRPIETSDTLTLLETDSVLVDLDRVNAERSDMRAIDAGIDALAGMGRMASAGFFPSLNGFASYEWNGRTIPATTGKNWMVGAVLRWNIFSGFDQIGDMQKYSAQRSGLEAEREKRRLSNAREIADALGELRTSRQLVELSDTMLTQTAEQLRVTADRYTAGFERTADLLMAQASYESARLSHAGSLFQHTMAVCTLEFLLERKVSR